MYVREKWKKRSEREKRTKTCDVVCGGCDGSELKIVGCLGKLIALVSLWRSVRGRMNAWKK